ncbi:uncharacterized protein SPSK_00684 [Sporothrix schenckii 1099-18]|uniref:Uncharacterized protein n=1 Tax=Sporothrix schenckii 1099-18 TaxID=1397361 RepID=A0A0F2LXN8_SPOSC|nr:uncharacterized protein SPSK_00684 [Sporothrix schenckii 1099-18]KJR81599.1 hypothetical protein SPSK_00684 [Sporothrix schenckii 1099-18]
MASVLSGVKRSFAAASADWDGPTAATRPQTLESESAANARATASSSTSSVSSISSTKSASSAMDTAIPRLQLPVVHAAVAANHSRNASLPSPTSQPSGRPHYDADASVILTGVRGAGKSTLAVIASTAMRRKIVEADKVFSETHGQPSGAFQREHGILAYRKAQSAVLQHILETHRRGAIIVCSWMERDVHARLAQCAATNPIVLILRDTAAIQTHLRVWDDARVQDLVTASGPVFRRCARFEFFNISETPSTGINEAASMHVTYSAQANSASIATSAPATGTTTPDEDSDARGPAPYLTLKRAERHFLKFLSLILPRGAIPFIESAYPLASLATEDRQFTYALSVRLSDFAAGDVDVEEMEAGADAIELIVDCVSAARDTAYPRLITPQQANNISRIVSHIRRSTVIPIIYHVVLPDPDTAAQNENQCSAYLSHVLHGLRLAPDYVTVDLRLHDAEIARVRAATWSSRIIGTVDVEGPSPSAPSATPPPSWHDPTWLAYYRRAVDLGCHVARLTRRAVELSDNFEVSQFIYSAKMSSSSSSTPPIPLIAYNTGPKGRFSACFNSVLTSVVAEPPTSSPAAAISTVIGSANGMDTADTRTSTTPTSDSVSRPARLPSPSDFDSSLSSSSLTARQATIALASAFVYEPMRLYVFGAYVDYSVSPAMHHAALAACGLPHTYRPNSTDSMELINTLIHDPRFGGASVGLPFKVSAIRLTHTLSNHARAVGAINTIVPIRQLKADGSVPDYGQILTTRNQSGPVLAIYGENTDWIGIRACIRRGLSPANAVRPGSVGLVIGAGGMARAAVYAMLQLGVKQIVVTNRTVANAEKMVAHFTGMLDRGEMAWLSRGDDADQTQAQTQTQFHVMRTHDDPWPAGFRLPTMIISCIPTHRIGAVPAPDLTLPPAWFGSPTGGVLVELAYKTLQTPLLNQSRKLAQQGWVSMDGLDLLPEQGFAQFELFTGRRAPRRLMREEVFKAHKDDQGRSNLPQLQGRLDNIVNQEP